MKTNKLLFTAIMSAMLVGCSEGESLNLTNENPVVYTGSVEKTASRVLLGEDNMLSWVLGDEISIFPFVDVNNQFQVISIDDDGSATFELLDFVDNPDYSDLDYTYAVYPFYRENSITGEAITTPVPTTLEYTGRENSIKSALMSAKSDTEHLYFTNAQGILRLRLNAVTPFKYGPVASIKLESASNKLSGTATIDYANGDTPEAKIATGENYLLVNVDAALQQDLPASKTGKFAEFYIPVVPTRFAVNDLTMTVTWQNGETYVRPVGISFGIVRKKIYTLSHTIEGVPTYSGDLEDMEEDTQAWEGEIVTKP